MIGWIVGKIRWLFLIAAVGGPVLAYVGYTDQQRIAEIRKSGVEAVAMVDGATQTKRRRGGTSYSVNLVWKDHKGAERRADKVHISRKFADQIIRDDKIMRDTLKIKYLADDAEEKPILAEDVDHQEANDASMVPVGIGAGIVGAIGSIIMLVIRRRRSEA